MRAEYSFLRGVLELHVHDVDGALRRGDLVHHQPVAAGGHRRVGSVEAAGDCMGVRQQIDAVLHGRRQAKQTQPRGRHEPRHQQEQDQQRDARVARRAGAASARARASRGGRSRGCNGRGHGRGAGAFGGLPAPPRPEGPQPCGRLWPAPLRLRDRKRLGRQVPFGPRCAPLRRAPWRRGRRRGPAASAPSPRGAASRAPAGAHPAMQPACRRAREQERVRNREPCARRERMFHVKHPRAPGPARGAGAGATRTGAGAAGAGAACTGAGALAGACTGADATAQRSIARCSRACAEASGAGLGTGAGVCSGRGAGTGCAFRTGAGRGAGTGPPSDWASAKAREAEARATCARASMSGVEAASARAGSVGKGQGGAGGVERCGCLRQAALARRLGGLDGGKRDAPCHGSTAGRDGSREGSRVHVANGCFT